MTPTSCQPLPASASSPMIRAGRLTALASVLLLGGLLAGCQTMQDLQLSLPPELAAGAQRCAVQTESGWGGSTLKACEHSLKNVGGTTTTSSGSSWDAGLAGSRSTDKRIRFRYQFTASGSGMQEWRCERLEQEKVRHIARVLWKGEHEGSVSCATQTATGEERYHYDTRQPDRVTWFQGGTAQVWTLVPQTRWLANGRLVDSPVPMGWCAYGEDGRILGCHDWISPGGVVWTVPQSQAQPRDLQRLVQLALGPKQLWGMD